MSTLRELKRRIKSITSTQQMTQAMKMVAVSKYNRALARLEAYRPYQVQCRHLLQSMGGTTQHNQERPVKKVCYVAVTGNRGLCGTYNQEVLRCLREELKAQTLPWQLILCGKWGNDNAAGLPHETVPISDIPTWEESNALAERLTGLYQSGEVDEVRFVYQQFKNILTQVPVCQLFLPQTAEETGPAGVDYLFEPGREQLEQALYTRCLYAQVYEILLAAATGVQGAMMMSMRTASDNSAALIEKLSLTMNRKRQSSVTTQVLEIASSSMQEEEGL